MENGLTASDIAFLGNNGGNCMNGMGRAFWIFALLILAGGGFGNFGNNGLNGNSNAIQADVNRGFDNQNLQAQTRDILGSVTNGTAQINAASSNNAANAFNAIKDGNFKGSIFYKSITNKYKSPEDLEARYRNFVITFETSLLDKVA